MRRTEAADNYRGMEVGMLLRDAAQQGCCARAYMDVFTAIPQKHTRGRAAVGGNASRG
jgi:hypothetical protein